MKNKLLLLSYITISMIFVMSGCGIRDRYNSQTVSPVRKNITDAVFASGYTINSDDYIVATNTEGFILKSFVKEGDEIEIGDPLFQLSNEVQSMQLDNALAQYNDALNKANPNSPQILSLKTQIEQAKTQAELDKKNLDRYTVLVKTNAVSQLEYDNARLRYEASKSNVEILKKSLADLQNSLALNLKNAKNQLKIQQSQHGDYFIKSTRKGKILFIYKKQGELARRGEYLSKIGSGTTLAKLFIAEEDIRLVKVGQKVKIALNTMKEQTLDAVISKVYPAFDMAEQSYILEAKFADNTNSILANTQLQANIVIAERKNALVIPFEYINDDNTVTLVDDSDIPVDVGIKSGKWVEILAGIDESNRIIVRH